MRWRSNSKRSLVNTRLEASLPRAKPWRPRYAPALFLAIALHALAALQFGRLLRDQATLAPPEVRAAPVRVAIEIVAPPPLPPPPEPALQPPPPAPVPAPPPPAIVPPPPPPPEPEPVVAPQPAAAQPEPTPEPTPASLPAPPLEIVPAPAPALQPKLDQAPASRQPPSTGAANAAVAVDEAPTPRGAIRPLYPLGARQRGEAGTVEVRVEVDAEGRVRAATLVRGSGFTDLDQAALTALRRARFRPARRGGEAVGSNLQLTVVFRLTD